MSGLNVTFNIPDVDVTLTDPEDPAHEIAEVFNEYLRANGRSDLQVDVLYAKWDDPDDVDELDKAYWQDLTEDVED